MLRSCAVTSVGSWPKVGGSDGRWKALNPLLAPDPSSRGPQNQTTEWDLAESGDPTGMKISWLLLVTESSGPSFIDKLRRSSFVKQNSSSLGPVDELQNTQDLFNKRHLPPKQTFFSPRDVTSLRLPRISPRESVPIETRPLPSPCILAFFSSFCRPDRHATYAFVSFESPAQRLRSTGNVEGR